MRAETRCPGHTFPQTLTPIIGDPADCDLHTFAFDWIDCIVRYIGFKLCFWFLLHESVMEVQGLIWKKLTMTTMYWWFLVDIWSQIPPIHHKTVHVFQVLKDGILVPTYLTYNNLFNLVIQCSLTWSTKICFLPYNVLITKVVKQKTTHKFIISCLSIKNGNTITHGSQGQTSKDKTPSW